MISYIFEFEICYLGLLSPILISVFMLQFFGNVGQLMLRLLGKWMVGAVE